jgi:5-methylcytosine-specific restriction endonuclease McrA
MAKATEYVPHSGPIVTRPQARAAGVKQYFNGKPCPKGHLFQRYTRSGTCIFCELSRAQRPYDEAKRLYWLAWRHSESGKLWAAANAEKSKARTRNRRAKQRASSGSHTAREIADLLRGQRGRCAYCRRQVGKNYHVDHIVSVAKGGANDRRNLQITCALCNMSKGERDPIDHAKRIGLLI